MCMYFLTKLNISQNIITMVYVGLIDKKTFRKFMFPR